MKAECTRRISHCKCLILSSHPHNKSFYSNSKRTTCINIDTSQNALQLSSIEYFPALVWICFFFPWRSSIYPLCIQNIFFNLSDFSPICSDLELFWETLLIPLFSSVVGNRNIPFTSVDMVALTCPQVTPTKWEDEILMKKRYFLLLFGRGILFINVPNALPFLYKKIELFRKPRIEPIVCQF